MTFDLRGQSKIKRSKLHSNKLCIIIAFFDLSLLNNKGRLDQIYRSICKNNKIPEEDRLNEISLNNSAPPTSSFDVVCASE